jgi:leucyl aminopeptidase
MIELPNFSAIDIAQDTAPFKRAQCDALDHLAIVMPAKPDKSLFRALPLGEHLRQSLVRATRNGAGRAQSRLTNRRGTGITIATMKPGTAFERLSWARKIVAECRKDSPAKLGLLAVGFDDATRQRVVEAIVAAAEAAAFELPKFKTSADSRKRSLSSLKILAAKPRSELAATRAAARGNNIARWLTALPPNVLTARNYCFAIEALAKRHGVKYEFIGENGLEKLGAGAFLAVSQGNPDRDAGIVVLRYRPKRQKRPDVTLIGKGILFDTGGTNLKPFKGMLEMHTDMQGSAVALGSLIALAELEAPFAVDAWLPITENRVSARSYKSQDVVTASNGTTIQVVHSDAEGRMVLADALALAARDAPQLILDYATLTGSCVTALTDRYSGAFSNRQSANDVLRMAGVDSGERVWPFPVDADFEEALRSEVADIKQCAVDGSGDHILAARFLMRFVPPEIPWIHVDLSAGQHKGGLAHVPTEITGFGVRLTLELLCRQAASPADLAAQLAS